MENLYGEIIGDFLFMVHIMRPLFHGTQFETHCSKNFKLAVVIIVVVEGMDIYFGPLKK
jgi:hypothetical protein